MPKVRMLTSAAGPDFAWAEGEIVDMTDEQAAAWGDDVRGVRLDREPETAARKAPEAAVARKGRGRQR